MHKEMVTAAQGERRSSERCPVCFGPTRIDLTRPEGLRCRNSLCRQNHNGLDCPRCGACEAEPAAFRDGKYHYTCTACQATWRA